MPASPFGEAEQWLGVSTGIPAAGELPIGAVVEIGGELVSRAFTQDRDRRRRPVHAELLAMVEADKRFGWGQRAHPLRMAATLEPCLMCLGTAMALGVREVYFRVGVAG